MRNFGGVKSPQGSSCGAALCFGVGIGQDCGVGDCGNALRIRDEEKLRCLWKWTAKEGLFQSVGLVFVCGNHFLALIPEVPPS